jgi:hypothetical protein
MPGHDRRLGYSNIGKFNERSQIQLAMFEQDKGMNVVKGMRLIGKRLGARSAGIQGARSSVVKRFPRFINSS